MSRINGVVLFGMGLAVLAGSSSLSSCQGPGDDAGTADSAGMEEASAPAHNVLSDEEVKAIYQLKSDQPLTKK